MVQVKDSGTCIQKENLEHIFDLLFTTKMPGTGLSELQKKLLQKWPHDMLQHTKNCLEKLFNF